MKRLPNLTIAAGLAVSLGIVLAGPALRRMGLTWSGGEIALAAFSSGEPARPGTKDAKQGDPRREGSPDDGAPVAGERILQLVRQRLIDYQPFRADVLETVVIGNRKFTVSGEYLQGRDLRLRLQLQLRVGNTEGFLLEVCDGQILSTRLQIGDDVQITRRDVRQILRAAVAEPDVPENLLIAELGLGGLSGLLAALERSMNFSPARHETIDGRSFTVIEGWWNEQFWEKWKKRGQRPEEGLPEYVPDGVRVYLDDSDFPRRFLYVKRVPGRELVRPMATLDFTRVVLRTAVPDDAFRFVPPDGVLPVDVTKQYLEQLSRPEEKHDDLDDEEE